MQLYTLNLALPLNWTEQDPAAWNRAFEHDDAEIGNDGAVEESVFFWNADEIIAVTEDGPRIVPKLPLPLRFGEKKAGDTGNIALAASRYLFAQSNLGGIASVPEAVEWFAREAWWTEARMEGPIVVRLVREDGKTALQVIRKLLD